MRYDNWDSFMAEQRRSGLLGKISDFVTAERRGYAETIAELPDRDVVAHYPPAIYPPSGDVMRFTTTPLRDVKVVILGQDPYHGPGQAHGLAFSYKGDVSVRTATTPRGKLGPPSLQNILEELRSDIGEHAALLRAPSEMTRLLVGRRNGDLTPWTRQGVLLLNTALTVRQADPGSHLDIWQPFTDEVVRAVVASADVAPHFILWGKPALKTFQRSLDVIADPRSRSVVEIAPGIFAVTPKSSSRRITFTASPHPSPLSADRGFFGSRPFSKANEALRLQRGDDSGCLPSVDWRLP